MLPQPQVIWFYGMPAAGKTTLTEMLLEFYNSYYLEKNFVLLDGDRLRSHFKLEDLSDYSPEGRRKFQTKLRERARDMCQEGKIVLVASISPYLEMRRLNRECFKNLIYHEVYIKCDLEVLIKRDPKGLYAKALAGEITNMTGISDPFEEYSIDIRPTLLLNTSHDTIEQSYIKLKDMLKEVLQWQ